jgi:hypothetical protein
MSADLLDHWKVSRLIPRFLSKRAKPGAIALADRARDVGEWELAFGHYRAALLRKARMGFDA